MIKTDLILLLNVTAMFILSLCTDYWVYRGYDFRELAAALALLNDTFVSEWNQQLLSVEFLRSQHCAGSAPNRTVCSPRREYLHLFSEYGNLFRECNDLSDGYRELLHKRGLLYLGSCHYYVLSDSWHSFRMKTNINTAEKICFGLAVSSSVIMVMCVGIGAFSSIKSHLRLIMATGGALMALGLVYLLTIAVFVVKSQMIHEALVTDERATRVAQYELVARHRRSSMGWSFVAAVLSLLFISIAVYLYFASGRSMQERRKYLLRRRQLQIALMSSCRQEVALAIRAKLTVKTQDS